MSLTSFLRQSREVRLALQDSFPCPLKSVAFPILQAPPLTRNYALVGQAFDYLLRFYMQRGNPFASRQSHWVANLIQADLVFSDEEGEAKAQQEVAARPFLEQAYAHHQMYLTTGEISDDLLKSCLDLAIIDGLVRAGEIRGQLGKADTRDLEDLRHLVALIPSTPFLDGGPCQLNPVFSFPSGADCDLLIGETLIEIKTTKFSEVKQDYYQQLLGYYLLNLNDSRRYSHVIHSIGVYFSRHGYLWSVSIDALGGKDAFRRFLPLWNEQVRRYHSRRSQRAYVPAQRIGALIAQADQLEDSARYANWLSQLSTIDFLTWKTHAPAFHYVHGAIEREEARRKTLPQVDEEEN